MRVTEKEFFKRHTGFYLTAIKEPIFKESDFTIEDLYLMFKERLKAEAVLNVWPEEKMTKPKKKTASKNFVVTVPAVAFEVFPHDLSATMTYVNAVKAVAELDDGWRIPTLEELRLMYANKDAIGGFCTSDRCGSDFPDWYWSCTEHRTNPSFVWVVRFSDGYEYWHPKDYIRLSCRPVRLVAVPG